MGFWKSVTRRLGRGDAEFWRQPPFFRFRLARDYFPRLLYGLGMGLGISGLLVALLMASAPPGQFVTALLMSVGLVFACTLLMFLIHDLVEVTIELDDAGIRRATKPLLLNPFGTRRQQEFWKYSSITRCGLASATDLEAGFSALVLGISGRMVALGIPRQIDLEEVANRLEEHGLEPRRLKSIPAEARPGSSVSQAGAVRAVVAAGLGVLLSLAGAGSRFWLQHGPRQLDDAAVQRVLASAPECAAVRNFSGLANEGPTVCQLSADGQWVWGIDKATRKHLVWKATQEAPHGELAVPEAVQSRAEFIPTSNRVVVCADRTAHVFRLDPPEPVFSFELKELPDSVVAMRDGKHLIVVTLVSVRQYDLESGQVIREHVGRPPGAVISAALTPDEQAVRIACQAEVIEVRLADGAVTNLVKFEQPQKVYLFGAMARSGEFAALQGSGGIEVFDLNAKKQSSLSAGISYLPPAISGDGQRIAAAFQGGYGVWDVAMAKAIARCPQTPASQVSLTSDGKRILTWSPGSAKLTLWSIP